MAEVHPINTLDSLDLNALKKLLEEVNCRIKNEKSKNMFKTNVTIPAEYRGHFEAATEWAYKRNLINKRSRWAFCKFAIINTINFILGEIEKEKLLDRKQP